MTTDGTRFVLAVLILVMLWASAMLYWLTHLIQKERHAMKELVDSAFQHMIARTPRDVAEANALKNYEAEAVRQAKEAFNHASKRPITQDSAPTAVGPDGTIYEIVE
jgi:hypothetical protein